jgi:hypothetical protein
MKSEWITFQGKRIFFCHFDNMDAAALREEVDACDNVLCCEPAKSALVLSDIRGTLGTPEVVSIFKKSTTKTRDHVNKSAVVGIGFSGPRKIMFDLVMKFSGQNVVVFEDIQKAKDWLVKD